MPCSLPSGGISTAQACEIISRVSCVGYVNLVDWKQLEQEKYTREIKGEKRNGALSRQQAFGKLFKR